MFSFITKNLKRRRLEKEGLATQKKRLKEEESLWHIIDKSPWVSALILVILCAYCAFFLIVHSFNTKEPGLFLVENQLVPRTIYSDFNFTYLDQTATDAKREMVKASVPLMFVIRDSVCEESIKGLKGIIQDVDNASKLEDPETAKIQDIPVEILPPLITLVSDKQQLSLFTNKFSYILYSGIISEDDSRMGKDKLTNICVIDKFNHVRPSMLLTEIPTPSMAAKIFAESVSSDYSPHSRKLMYRAVYIIARKVFKPNLFFDGNLTQVEREMVSSSPNNEIYKQIHKGDVIIKKGEKVTNELLDRSKAYETEKNKRIVSIKLRDIIYQTAIALSIILVLLCYLYIFNPAVFSNNNKLATGCTVIILNLILIVVFDRLFIYFTSDFAIPSALKSVSIPLALTPILVSSLIGQRAAAFASMLVYLLVAFRIDSYYVIVTGMALSCFSAWFVRNAKNYKEFLIKSMLSVPIIMIPVEVIGLMPLVEQYVYTAPLIIMFSVINGIVTGALCLGFLFIIESLFKINTDMTLLSLCDYNHPLLKKLQIEAPGTYHHSLIVAILAEHAAVTIGASPIKARVCALFHDIGKLATPEYFIENNSDCYLKHDNLKPAMSSMIIMNHVKEGMTLALQYRLNSIIRDAIQQHHGTDLVYFFYKKAIDEYGVDEVQENEYRYPGPRPTKKEVVLVTLADVCEAASRTLEKPTPYKIETLVWEIIRKKIREGQLDHADLSFAELAKARDSFTKTLNTMLHSRITYPTDNEGDSDEGAFHKPQKEPVKDTQKRNGKTDQQNG